MNGVPGLKGLNINRYRLGVAKGRQKEKENKKRQARRKA